MAKKFPIVPVLLGVGLLGGIIYLATKKTEVKPGTIPPKIPEKSPDTITPGRVPPDAITPGIPRAVPIFKSPFLQLPQTPVCSPGAILLYEGDPKLEKFPYGGWGIDPVTNRRYKCVQISDLLK